MSTIMRFVCTFTNILLSSCFESIKAKLKFSFLCLALLTNKHEKLIDHERENLAFDRNYGPKVDKRKLIAYNCV